MDTCCRFAECFDENGVTKQYISPGVGIPICEDCLKKRVGKVQKQQHWGDRIENKSSLAVPFNNVEIDLIARTNKLMDRIEELEKLV